MWRRKRMRIEQELFLEETKEEAQKKTKEEVLYIKGKNYYNR